MTETKPNITLSTGRIIRHERMPNGAWDAIPTTGPREFTNEEWEEYVKIGCHESKTLIWKYIPGDNISAALSVSGPYVISHREKEYNLSYRPPSTHIHLGIFATLEDAKNTAQNHLKVNQ